MDEMHRSVLNNSLHDTVLDIGCLLEINLSPVYHSTKTQKEQRRTKAKPSAASLGYRPTATHVLALHYNKRKYKDVVRKLKRHDDGFGYR